MAGRAHLLLALALFAPAHGAFGQEKPTPDAGSVPAATPPVLPGAQPSGLDDRQKLARAQEGVAQVRRLADAVARRLEEGRRERDLERVGCLADQAARLKGLLRVAEEAAAALRESVARKEEGSEAELTRLDLARARALDARTEAEACVGRLRHAVDEKTTVEAVPPRGR
jgi:hypothetical protein